MRTVSTRLVCNRINKRIAAAKKWQKGWCYDHDCYPSAGEPCVNCQVADATVSALSHLKEEIRAAAQCKQEGQG